MRSAKLGITRKRGCAQPTSRQFRSLLWSRSTRTLSRTPSVYSPGSYFSISALTTSITRPDRPRIAPAVRSTPRSKAMDELRVAVMSWSTYDQDCVQPSLEYTDWCLPECDSLRRRGNLQWWWFHLRPPWADERVFPRCHERHPCSPELLSRSSVQREFVPH